MMDENYVIIRVVDNDSKQDPSYRYFEASLAEVNQCIDLVSDNVFTYMSSQLNGRYYTSEFDKVKTFILKMRMDKTVDDNIKDLLGK